MLHLTCIICILISIIESVHLTLIEWGGLFKYLPSPRHILHHYETYMYVYTNTQTHYHTHTCSGMILNRTGSSRSFRGYDQNSTDDR